MSLVKDFPFLNCRNRNARLSPFRMDPPTSPASLDSGDDGRKALGYCFDIAATARAPRNSPCSSMDDINRIDLIVGEPGYGRWAADKAVGGGLGHGAGGMLLVGHHGVLYGCRVSCTRLSGAASHPPAMHAGDVCLVLDAT
jgi:hypothetical protein